jgi:hypothetical protein
MTELTVTPNEGSTIVITVDFKDIGGTDFTPETCAWSLSKKDGTFINSRERVATTVSGFSHDFVIFGDDLLFADGKDRYFLVEGTYDSVFGNDLPFRDEAHFMILDTKVDPI